MQQLLKRSRPKQINPSTQQRRLLPPAISILLRWGFFALVAIGVVLSVVLGLVQKWLWMRQLDYAGIFWTLLSVKWGIFGVALIVSIFYLWINLRFAARNIDVVGRRKLLQQGLQAPRRR